MNDGLLVGKRRYKYKSSNTPGIDFIPGVLLLLVIDISAHKSQGEIHTLERGPTEQSCYWNSPLHTKCRQTESNSFAMSKLWYP